MTLQEHQLLYQNIYCNNSNERGEILRPFLKEVLYYLECVWAAIMIAVNKKKRTQ